MNQHEEHVSQNPKFNIGYYEGQQHCKIWLACKDDFALMYKKYPKGEITLWCDGRGEEEDEDVGTKKRKKADGDKVTRRQEREDEIDDVVKQLKEKHKDLYTLPNYRLWARSVCGNLHDDLDTPPDLPSFQGHTAAKKAPRESLQDALTGAAVTFAKVFKDDRVVEPAEKSAAEMSKIELRMKNFEQLRYVQQLFNDGILTDAEYNEQKETILLSLRKLN